MSTKIFEIKFGDTHLKFPDTKQGAEIAIKLIEEYLKWETTVFIERRFEVGNTRFRGSMSL